MYINNFQSTVHHPKTIPLGLLNEIVAMLSAAGVRCSLLMESGKVATLLDETLNNSAISGKLQHSAQLFLEFTLDHIVSLYTCPLYTVAKLKSRALYWWYVVYYYSFQFLCFWSLQCTIFVFRRGVLPFAQRKKCVKNTEPSLVNKDHHPAVHKL